MADELKRVGLVFKADGAVDFTKSLKEVNSSIQENRSAFKLAQSQWNESTTSSEKLADKQKYLSNQTKDYSDKVKMLSSQLEELEGAENRDEAAINRKKTQLNQTKTSLNNYKKGLDAVEDELKTGASNTEKYTKKLGELAEKSKATGEKLSGISTAAAGVLAGAGTLVPATEEYRKIMGSLDVSSELAGYSAEQTKQIYNQLFGVLADDQSAATTTANLQALKLSQDQLQQITMGTIGAWAKYGDSIPIDGLAESINETVKVGQVTGTFADVLNWAGTSEDSFNEKLKACSSDSERANLVMQELANQGLMQAGQKWQENNKNLVEGNNATAQMKQATADLATTIAPLITAVTQIVAGLIGKFNALPTSVQATIGIALVLVAILSSVFKVVGNVSSGISGMTNVMRLAGTGAKALWGIMAANPIGATITVVTLLVTAFITLYNKCEWFRDGVNKVFNSVKKFLTGVKDWLKNIFNFEWKLPKIKLPHFKVKGSFSLNPPSFPTFGVDWYRKAQNKAHILNGAQIFGMMNGKALGGGEAGSEMVVGTNYLLDMIRKATPDNSEQITETNEKFDKLLNLMEFFFPKFILGSINISDREFKRTLKEWGVVFE